MIEVRLTNAVDRCLAAIRRGRSLEESLRVYPSLRPELDSLVQSALHLTRTAQSGLQRAGKDSSRTRLMTAIQDQAAPQRNTRGWTFLPDWRFVLVPAFATVVFAVVLIGYVFSRASGESDATTVLTILQGDVKVETGRGVAAARDGMRLTPGDGVITGPDARAVITFVDGSTVTLAGDAVIILRSVEDAGGKLRVVLSQPQGSTWTYVPESAGSTEVEIETPSARVQTQTASVETTVRSGQTQVGAESGIIGIESDAVRTDVPNGYRVAVDAPGSVVAPLPAEKAPRELLLLVHGKAYAFLTDPHDATVGTLAPGILINQVTGARVEQHVDDLLVRIPNPVDGEYRLGISAGADGLVSVTAIVQNGSRDQMDTSFTLASGESLSIGFGLQQDDLVLLSTRKELAVTPSKVVVPDRAIEKANAAASPSSPPTASPTTTPQPQPTATPSPTATPQPSATPVPPKATPVAVPVDRELVDSQDAGPSSLR